MVKLVTSSVVRGSQQGESHGGVYLIDIENASIEHKLDWNTLDIDWQGHDGDRGLRGIAFDGERIFIAASDALFAYTPDFELIGSWRNPYLKHCHEITIYERSLFLTSTAYDCILGFDLDNLNFNWAMNIQNQHYRFNAKTFDPNAEDGPLMLNKLHINNVHCSENGMYITGLRTGGMLHFNGKAIQMAVELPPGTHNAQPFRDGVLFNDSEANVLRYTGRGEGAEDRALLVPRPGFARGLCVLSDKIVAGGVSPSTITLYDLAANRDLVSINISQDENNAIHGLALWPY